MSMLKTCLMAGLTTAVALTQGCASVVPTQTGSTAAAEVAQVSALLKSQADRWDEAIVRKDRAAIEANMAEDFRQIDGQGNIETKASFVADVMAPELMIQPYKVEDYELRLYGDVALISGRTRMTGSYQGKAFTTHYRYIDVYVRRGGVWKIVNVQISTLPS